jgi:hypothetical protein
MVPENLGNSPPDQTNGGVNLIFKPSLRMKMKRNTAGH